MDCPNLLWLEWWKAVFQKINYVLDGLFDSFGEETILDDDDGQNCDEYF